MDFIHILLIFNVDFLSVMLATGYPDPPTDVRIHVNGSTAMVSWIIPTNQGITWSGISLKDSEKGDVVLNSTKKNTYEYIRIPISSFEIDNLKICSEYTVEIRFSSTTGYSKYTTQKFWMTNTTLTADINENVTLSLMTGVSNFFYVKSPNLTVLFEVQMDTVIVNGKEVNLKYIYENSTSITTAINITVLLVNQRDAGLYRVVENGNAVGCCLLVVIAKPEKPKLTYDPVDYFVNGNITFVCSSTVQRWPGYMYSNISYQFCDNQIRSTGSNSLTLYKLAKSDKGRIISCKATDDHGKVSSMSDNVTLDPYYGPDNAVLQPAYPAINITEGTKLGPITCIATCNPECLFEWKLNKTSSFQFVQSGKTLDVANIKRNETGTYRCRVVHPYDKTLMKRTDISVNVQYSPEITAFWLRAKNGTYGSNNPTTYIFSECINPQMILRIESNPDPQLVLSSSLLMVSPLSYTKLSNNFLTQLPSLKCEYSGNFTIQARNGIAYGDNKTVNLIIWCKPRDAETGQRKIGTKINTDVNIVMDVVSFPAPNVTWIRMTSFKWTVRIDQYDYRHKISSTIQIKSESGFGKHGIKICNTLGCIVENITLIPEDRPEAPQNVSSEAITFRSVNISWIAGFNGGDRQTFSVQFKTVDDDKWDTRIVPTNETRTGNMVYYSLDQLKPDTSYQVMVLSTNKNGKRNASLEFKTKVEPTLTSPSSASVSPLSIGIGCGIAVLLLLIFLLVFISRRQKNSNTESKESNVLYAEVDNMDKEQQKSKRRKPVKEDSDEPENAEYASVVKSKSKKVHYKEDAIETENNEYAVVDKSNKDYTENESVYANQEDRELLLHKPLEAQSSGRSTNQDGLTYIEVSFTSNQSDRRPIIGAESKTDYVDIDFTRKADPLPDDSD